MLTSAAHILKLKFSKLRLPISDNDIITHIGTGSVKLLYEKSEMLSSSLGENRQIWWLVDEFICHSGESPTSLRESWIFQTYQFFLNFKQNIFPNYGAITYIYFKYIYYIYIYIFQIYGLQNKINVYYQLFLQIKFLPESLRQDHLSLTLGNPLKLGGKTQLHNNNLWIWLSRELSSYWHWKLSLSALELNWISETELWGK